MPQQHCSLNICTAALSDPTQHPPSCFSPAHARNCCRSLLLRAPRCSYDPSLPPVEGPDDVQEVHVAWAEDLAMETALK
jgi:hypothetical protein